MPEQYDKTSSCIFSDVTLSLSAYRYTFNRYVEEDVHRGRRHRKDTVRQHALIIGDLRIVAVVVTDGNAGDSLALAEPCARGARGSGHMLGDSAYCSRENCRLAAGLGRELCFRPKKAPILHEKAHDAHASGQGALLPAQEGLCAARHGRMGQDAGLVQGPPGMFCRTYGRRNTIESCFSAVKDRFNFRIRFVTLEMQRREIAVISICRSR